MINLDSLVLKLSPEEILLLNDLPALVNKAIEDATLINDTYTFKANQESTVVWSDDYNVEYFTREGIWQARYLHQSYDVECTAQAIYELYRDAYLYEKGLTDDKHYSRSKEIANYFRGFVNKTKKIKETLS